MIRSPIAPLAALLLLAAACGPSGAAAAEPAPAASVDFEKRIRPLFAARCVSCHGPTSQEGGLRLDAKAPALRGGDGGPAFAPGKSADSALVRRVAAADESDRMPPKGKGDPLSKEEISLLTEWIDAGAPWPEAAGDRAADRDPRLDHWAWRPIQRPTPPADAALLPAVRAAVRDEIDRFIFAKLAEEGLPAAPEADRRTLVRRVYFDLVGLPPAPDEVEQFVVDPDPRAYEKLVDRLLASPRYGERWARHWLDVVHYGDTHGYDKDQPRPHAWPYRDYVVRAFNEDRPYARFIQEQVAGDVLFPESRDGIEALGFLAAGPWDLIGHAEVPETKTDGKIARHLDRDDVVATVVGTFCSVTVQCAQCHNHKFDPFTQEDYYSLQAVFAALDRTDRKYFADSSKTKRYRELEAEKTKLVERKNALDEQARAAAGPALVELDRRIDELAAAPGGNARPEYGWHSAIASSQDQAKWVQVDLGRPQVLDRIVLRPCYDDFNGVGAGFGFPLRYKIEACDDPDFQKNPQTIRARLDADAPNPGVAPQTFAANGATARYLRVTAVKLAPRRNDYIFALAELQAFDAAGEVVSDGAAVTALDSIEAPPRWRKANLVDRIAPREERSAELSALREQRKKLLESASSEAARAELAAATAALEGVESERKSFPAPDLVYAGGIHHGAGAFAGTGGSGGKPRPIRILARGNVLAPGREVGPGAVLAFDALPGRFELPPNHAEGDRRAALAKWLSDPRNPLVWRSIVNRVWQYHFGRGLVETSNDFGRMGRPPTHPELLDFLASDFRDGGGSIKALHRRILASAAYRRASRFVGPAAEAAERVDAENRFLWRRNRRKLEAEAVHDAVLFASGKLDLTMGGPGYKDFVVENPQHSPHYQYHLADPLDPRTWRRSVYRFVVRSQTQPFLTALDCADPSMRVEKRNESVSPQQALALLNNGFILTQSRFFAERLAKEAGDDPARQAEAAVRIALGRPPAPAERDRLAAFIRARGLPNLCRALFNLNEFSFVD